MKYLRVLFKNVVETFCGGNLDTRPVCKVLRNGNGDSSIFRNYPVCAWPSRVAGSVSLMTKQEINRRSIRWFFSIGRCAWTPYQDIATRAVWKSVEASRKMQIMDTLRLATCMRTTFSRHCPSLKRGFCRKIMSSAEVQRLGMHPFGQQKYKISSKWKSSGLAYPWIASHLWQKKTSPTVSSTFHRYWGPSIGRMLVGWKRFRRAQLAYIIPALILGQSMQRLR